MKPFRSGSFILLLVMCQHFPTFNASETSLTQTILKDLRSAFQVITNNSKALDHLIPAMYGPVMEQRNPQFVFKIPLTHATYENAPTSYSMWTMERSQLGEPVFPNVTVEQIRAQMQKRRHQPVTPTSKDDDWSLLGLPGWTGPLSPTPVPSSTVHDAYPLPDITKDVNVDVSSTTENSDELEPNERNAPATSTSPAYHNDSNVYIARVNDPFGYSVKWELKNSSAADERSKRDVVKLYSMIQCSTGCNPLGYKAYGCFCGFLGSGLPVDGIDRCCKVHDKCYENSNCISYSEYFVPYIWKCFRGKPLCAIDHGEWGGPDSCAARLCYCDLRLSRCLRQFTCPRSRAVCRSSPGRRLQNLLLAFK